MQKKRGISLIVLVITIIVMIILAGAIILSLNNSEIIERANKAVRDTDEATVKELAQMAWAEAYADGVRKVETENGIKGFEDRVKETLSENKIDLEKYLLKITTNGVTVKALSKAWVKKDFTVVRGEDILQIGDIVNYDETEGGTIKLEKDVEWKVLGADEEGNLLLMSVDEICTQSIGGKTLDVEKNMWLTAKNILNDLCKPYGRGKGAIQARSITVEDINTVTGYDPETAGYGKGELYEYGNKVTYSYNGTTTPSYSSTVASGILTRDHNNGFHYYDENEFVLINNLLTGELDKQFAMLTSNIYSYCVADLKTVDIVENSKVYSMLCKNDDVIYWLASTWTKPNTSSCQFGIFRVNQGKVDNYGLWRSEGAVEGYDSRGVRAVVTLSSDISFTGSSDTSWSY